MLFYKAQIYCLFVVAVLFVMCWFGIKQRGRDNKIFNAVLLAGFVNLIFDIASNYTVNHLYTVHPTVNLVIHICFFLSMAVLFMLAYMYLAALVEKELDRELKGKKLTYIPCIIVFVANLFTPLYYMETDQGNYSYGPGVQVLYASVIFYMGLIVWHIITFRKNISKKNRTAVILGLVSVVGSSMFQMFVPVALTSSLGVTLFCLFMYMTVANPDAVLVGLLKEETARADAANRAKSDFLAKMSHEIRTPINAVIGMNEMILRETSETEIQKYAYDIKSSANTLLSIINEILDSSKIESGKLEIIPVNYEVSSLFYDLHNMIDLKAKKKGLKLIFDIDPNMPSGYFGDDIRIRQILVNLLTNAVKYTEKGTVTMTVRAVVEGDVATIHYSVKDTGIGIKDEDLSKLFAKFERIEESRNRHIEGTGLGMNIAMQLLTLMDSELHVESVYGQGSEFYFDIKQNVINPEPIGDFYERIKQAASEYSYTATYIAPDAKILVVDDNDINRKVVRGLLKQSQVQVYEASSGQECLDMVKEQDYDIVFLDYMMPLMDGIETLHHIKEMGLCKDVPIIMLTANAVVGAKEQYLKEGFKDYLTKPIIPDKLDKMMLKYLPEHLVTVGEFQMEEQDDESKQELPQLDEFDFGYAMNLLKSWDMVEKTLTDVYGMLKQLPDKLADLYNHISEENSLNLYRIEVHALKSTSAMVGALLLSKVARILEVAAIEGDIGRIHVLHPILMDEIGKHRERIATILPQSDDKADVDNPDQILAYFDMLKVSLQGGDYNTADFICGEINKYRYPDKIQPLVETLAGQVMNLQADDAIATLDEIRSQWI